MNKYKKLKGFTLIELTVSMGLLVMVLGIIGGTFASIVAGQLESKATSSVDQDSRFIFARLTHDITSANGIVTPSNPGDSSASLIITVDSLNYIYSLDPNGNFLLDKGLGGEQLNGYNTWVSDLEFQKIGVDTVRVSFVISSKTQTKSGIESREVQTTLALP